MSSLVDQDDYAIRTADKDSFDKDYRNIEGDLEELALDAESDHRSAISFEIRAPDKSRRRELLFSEGESDEW